MAKINARSFAWHDFITFYRYRRNIVCTDSAQALTRGSPVGPMALLARLNPSIESYSCIYPSQDGSTPLIGHMQYMSGDRSARLIFLMPEDNLGQPEIMNLVEHMAAQAGAWGAFHLLAEVEENTCALDGLRRSGFSVYAWQRIWKFCPGQSVPAASNGNGKNGGSQWQPARRIDEIAIRNLFQALVPPLVQSAEPFTSRRRLGWVYRQDGEILAYVEGTNGPLGIYLQPLIHPALENVSVVLNNLLTYQPVLAGKQVYMAVRSYQAWLETVVRDLECEVGPRQALMVKHLVAQQRVSVQAARHSVLEKYTAEPTVPLFHNTTANK